MKKLLCAVVIFCSCFLSTAHAAITEISHYESMKWTGSTLPNGEVIDTLKDTKPGNMMGVASFGNKIYWLDYYKDYSMSMITSSPPNMCGATYVKYATVSVDGHGNRFFSDEGSITLQDQYQRDIGPLGLGEVPRIFTNGTELYVDETGIYVAGTMAPTWIIRGQIIRGHHTGFTAFSAVPLSVEPVFFQACAPIEQQTHHHPTASPYAHACEALCIPYQLSRPSEMYSSHQLYPIAASLPQAYHLLHSCVPLRCSTGRWPALLPALLAPGSTLRTGLLPAGTVHPSHRRQTGPATNALSSFHEN